MEASLVTQYLDNILTVVVALIGAWGIVWRSNRDAKKAQRSLAEDVAEAEIADRGKFRKALMTQLAEMRVLLAQCREEHQEAREALQILQHENQELKVEVSRLKLRIEQIELTHHNEP